MSSTFVLMCDRHVVSFLNALFTLQAFGLLVILFLEDTLAVLLPPMIWLDRRGDLLEFSRLCDSTEHFRLVCRFAFIGSPCPALHSAFIFVYMSALAIFLRAFCWSDINYSVLGDLPMHWKPIQDGLRPM